MFKDKKILAIIPARKGSKRLPSKNRLDCAGKPLASWTIDAALKSRYVDKVFFTTDDTFLADLALKMGAYVPELRPSILTSDSSDTIDVVLYVLDYIHSNTIDNFDTLILLQPTSPLRDSDDIDLAFEAYFQSPSSNIETLVSVSEVDEKYRLLMDDKDGYAFFGFREPDHTTRSQTFKKLYMPNGAIFIAPCIGFSNFYHDKTRLYIMDKYKSIDIDTLDDLTKAEAILKRINKHKELI